MKSRLLRDHARRAVIAACAALWFNASIAAQVPLPQGGHFLGLARLLQDPDAERRLHALRDLRLFLVPQQGASPDRIEKDILAAFAGGYRDVRAELGILLRFHLGVAWPTRVLQHILEHHEGVRGATNYSLSMISGSPLMQAAFDDLCRPKHDLPTAWLQSLMTSQPDLALDLLQRRREPPPSELLPALVGLLGRKGVSPAPVLMRTEAGRQLLLRWSEELPTERLAWLAYAGGDLRPHLGLLEERIQQALARGRMPSEETLWFLAKLPWADPGTDLEPLLPLIKKLWQAKGGRLALRPTLQAMGPAARFAADDLVSMLQTRDGGTGERLWAEDAAATLLAIGIRDPVDAWLRTMPLDPERFRGESRVLAEAWATVLTERVMDAPDAELTAAFTRWRPHASYLRPEQRGAVAMRLLAQAEAAGTPALHPITHGWLAGELGDEAHAQLAAFFARRKALGILPDPLSETIAPRLLLCHPDLAVTAMRDGLARVPQTLDACHPDDLSPVEKQHVAAAARELIELAVACPDLVPRPDAATILAGEAEATYVGRILARAGAAPLDTILPLLDEVRTRSFALTLLRVLGAHAAGAVEAVERLAAGDDERFQRLAAGTLACLGPGGVLRLGELVATRPQLQCCLVWALDSSDDDCAMAARALLELHFVPDQQTAHGLRERMQRRTDEKTKAFLMLLTADQPASDQEWLGVMGLEPAVLRQRVVQALGKSASGPLQLGAVVELLDDPDAGVRAAALATLLATPERTATCRRPLEEFAATAEAEAAARVREALSTRR